MIRAAGRRTRRRDRPPLPQDFAPRWRIQPRCVYSRTASANRRSDFNLARLFVGSEGTLGLTVEAKLKLVDLPRARATLVVEFAGLLEALAATPLILDTPRRPLKSSINMFSIPPV